MKANEAPEKLYIGGREHWMKTWTAFTTKAKKGDDIEYIRTDAFIEKVCNYLSYHLDTSKIDVNYKFDFIEEFRNYMKGDIDQCINSEHSREGLVDLQKVIDFISDNILDYIDVQTLGIEYSREFDKERFVQDFCSCR